MTRFGLVTAVAVALAMPSVALADHNGRMPWENPEEGMQRARAMGLPMLMVFSAEW